MERVGQEFTHYWGELRAELTARMSACTRVFFGDLSAPDVHTIEGVIRDGKKIRGCTVLAVCDALGGPIERALPTAVAIEYVHAASLVHDDIVDGDRTRRQRPAAWIVHGRRRAVLLGDVIFATALQRSAEIGREEVLTLSRAIAMVAAGAYKETLDARESATVLADGKRACSVYEQIIYLKTGALFAAAAELGAIAAEAAPPLRNAAFQFGARMGEAYQIADDLQDVLDRSGAAARSAQELAIMATLHSHFDLPPNADAALVAAMKTEIRRRIALALQALVSFPEGSRVALLRALPAAIVEPMIAAA